MATSPHFSRVSNLLNARETQAMIQFWDGLMENRKLCAKMGSDVLLTALSRDPTLLPKFRIFEGMQLREIAHHKKLAAHGQYIAYTFANIVSQMDDPQLARGYIASVARNHHKRDMNASHFDLFFTLLLAVMKKRLPPEQFTPEMADITQRGFRMLFAMFKDCLEELDQANPLPRVDSSFAEVLDIVQVSDDTIDKLGGPSGE